MDRVDVKALTDRAGIPEIVQKSTEQLAGSAMDVVRRQIVSLDQIVGRFTYRLVGRDPQTRPDAPPALEDAAVKAKDGREQVTGQYAGPVSRLAAFVVDAITIWVVFLLFVFGVAFVMDFIFHVDTSTSWSQTVIGVLCLRSVGLCVFLGWLRPRRQDGRDGGRRHRCGQPAGDDDPGQERASFARSCSPSRSWRSDWASSASSSARRAGRSTMRRPGRSWSTTGAIGRRRCRHR